MSTELRKIIVDATSDMLDHPDEHGIYPTSKFYDRLEKEVTDWSNQQPKPATNSSGQPIGDFPTGIPTAEDFERMHAEPVGYGDEDDWVLISKKYTQEEALAKIQAMMKKDWGWSEDEGGYPKDVNDLQTFDVGYGYDHDSYHYSEGGYWICSDNNKVTKRWEAWGVATQ